MIEHGGMLSGNGKLTISQVEGERCTGVCRGPCAQETPHLYLLLEDKGGRWQNDWQQTRSDEVLVKDATLYVHQVLK